MKRRLKNWVENFLIIINTILFLALVSGIEFFIDNILLLIFILILLIINTLLLFEYGDLIEE